MLAHTYVYINMYIYVNIYIYTCIFTIDRSDSLASYEYRHLSYTLCVECECVYCVCVCARVS